MKFDIITLFPNSFQSFFSESILKRAQESDRIQIHFWNPRDYSKDKHKKVDDPPFGGGGGMLMACQPLFDCIREVKKQNAGPVVYLSAGGEVWKQAIAESWTEKYSEIILLCGHYEGVDQRVIDSLVDFEISIGEYVLTGGEVPAMVLVDSLSRLVPGVIEVHSHENESFSENLDRKKEYPHYTRPADFEGMKVPDVLLSGNHAEIEKWRKENLH